MTRVRALLEDETGAVTVDFVVLSAAVVAMAMLIAPILRTPVSNLAVFIAGEVNEAEAILKPEAE